MSRLFKTFVAALALMLAFGTTTALAQNYPPVQPAPIVDGEQTVAQQTAERLADNADSAATRGDIALIEAIIADIESLNEQFPNEPDLEAALKQAKAALARAQAAAPASVPAAAPVAAPAGAPLAMTGGDISLPVTAGAILVGSGGLLLLAANKRRFKFEDEG